jgi:hypothetical protein
MAAPNTCESSSASHSYVWSRVERDRQILEAGGLGMSCPLLITFDSEVLPM